MSQGSYEVKEVQPDDVDDVMMFLKRTFFIDEPMNKAVGLCSAGPDSCPELEEYCSKSLQEQLSFMAVDADGAVVGVMISGVNPLKEDDSEDSLIKQAQKCTNSKFQKILYVLARREEGAKLWEKYPQEKNVVEVKIASTDLKWRKRGIMGKLLASTEEATQKRGIKLIRIDTSSAYSAMSAERNGYTCVYKMPYKDITLDGKPIIVPEPPHNEDRVYVKELFE